MDVTGPKINFRWGALEPQRTVTELSKGGLPWDIRGIERMQRIMERGSESPERNIPFYPDNVTNHVDKWKYYATQFPLGMIKASDFCEFPSVECCQDLVTSISHVENFQWIVKVPKIMIVKFSRVQEYWESFEKIIRVFADAGRLAFVLFRFPKTVYVSSVQISRFKKLEAILPSDIHFTFEFRNSSWKDSIVFQEILKRHANWNLPNLIIENEMVGAGWAGSLVSSKLSEEIMISLPSPIASAAAALATSEAKVQHVVFLYGSYGKNCGSYDLLGYLERLVDKCISFGTANNVNIYMMFFNNKSSYCYPLPTFRITDRSVSRIHSAGASAGPGGIRNVRNFGLLPPRFPLGMPPLKLHDLPIGVSDRPCCLHDAYRIKELVRGKI